MNWYKKAQEEIPHPKEYRVKAIKHKEQGRDWYLAKVWHNDQYLATVPSMYEFKDDAIKAGWGWLDEQLHGYATNMRKL